MNVLKELVYYCNEPNPVGALMLTGEWGCGKTYLIENDLCRELCSTHVIVRVSLFGIDGIDALKPAVKRQWITSCGAFLGRIFAPKEEGDKANTLINIFGSLVGAALPWAKDLTDTLRSLDFLDYVSIKNEIDVKDDKKRVILVFDDLERSKLDTIDVLGCINEYCENQHFATIIIANEDKINDVAETNRISYSEIKEKIVSRTIRYIPDMDSIVHSVIDECTGFGEEYQDFLKANETLILGVFGTDQLPDEEDERPHNIRSLKCALQGFHRIYESLSKNEIPEIDKYLLSFIAYTMAARAKLAKKTEDGIYNDQEVSRIYPVFHRYHLIGLCSGKLLLDTKGVVFVQEMVYWRTNKNTSLYKGSQTRTGGLP